MKSDLVSTTPSWREREFLTMKYAGEILGVSPASLYVMAKNGRLKLERFAGRTVIRASALAHLLDQTDTAWVPDRRQQRAANARRQRGAA